MEPGVHDITIEQYHSGLGVSRSGIELFRRAPIHYWHKYLNADKDKSADEKPDFIRPSNSTQKGNALHFGNAFHTYVLEPEEFEKRYMAVEVPNRASNAGKAAYAHMLQHSDGRQLIDQEALTELTTMARAIYNSPTASGLIADGAYEKSLFWKDKETDILCKARPDIWHKNMIVDLKTCEDASFSKFQRDLYNYGYHIQAAMIHEGLHKLYGTNMMNFVYVAIEKKPPYAVAVYQLDEMAVHKGLEDYKKALFDMKLCFQQDRWPSYNDAVMPLPAYTN